MKKYDSYKDSGVKWIGQIPNHWKLMTNKYFTKSQKNKSEFGDEVLLSVSEYQGVIPRRKIREGEEHLSRSESLVGYLKVRKGELVSNIMLMWKRGLGVSEYEGIVSPSYSVFSFKKSEPKYFHYLYRTEQYVSEFRRNSTGVIESRLRLYDDSFGSLKSHFPPLHEQQQIVSYLDTKTSLINSLIEKTQRKIELLKEKRTSLINDVVTTGLNPNVEMKDSGVNWIGEIPGHWTITKVKYETNLVNDGSHFTPTYTENGIPFLRVTDIHNKKIDLDKVKFISEEEHRQLIKRCNPKRGDLLLSKNGTIGLTKVIDWDWDFSIFVSLCLIKFKKVFKPELFSYFFQSSIVDLQIKESSKQSTVTNLHLDKIRELLLIKPPLNEQQQIVEYLDTQTGLVDKTISIEEKRIELLKEYRQSLISEVVTGKRKVV